MTNRLFFYHKSCSDGAISAAIAYKFMGDKKAEFKAIDFNQNILGDLGPNFGKGESEVYFLDVTPSVDSIRFLSKQGYKVVIIDHHTNSLEMLRNELDQLLLENIEIHDEFKYSANVGDLDTMLVCGASLTWDYFHRSSPPPSVVELISFHDNYDRSRGLLPWYVHSYIEYHQTDSILELSKIVSGSIKDIIEIGKVIYTINRTIATEIVNTSESFVFEGNTFTVVNAPRVLRNFVADIVLENNPDAVVVITQKNKHIYYHSMRANKSFKGNLADLAFRHNGNGHRTAAAFRSTLPFYDKVTEGKVRNLTDLVKTFFK